jgi:hypothetical protein
LSQEALVYINKLSEPGRGICLWLDTILESQGCVSYVKTIYIGYEIDGEMVAAVYGHGNKVEIAMALPENHASSLLQDATHLKWRTLPLSVVVDLSIDQNAIEGLVNESCNRVATKTHRVDRDSDYFMKIKQAKIQRRP